MLHCIMNGASVMIGRGVEKGPKMLHNLRTAPYDLMLYLWSRYICLIIQLRFVTFHDKMSSIKGWSLQTATEGLVT